MTRSRFQTPYTHDRSRSSAYGTVNEEPSLTQQSDKDDTDINILVKRFGVTGQMPQLTIPPKFGDFSNVPDYRTAMDQIKEANDLFAELPANVRKRFNNDPAQFVDFATNDENLDELRKLGLAKPEDPVEYESPTPPPVRYSDEGPIPTNDAPPAQRTNNGNAPTDQRATTKPAAPAAGRPPRGS